MKEKKWILALICFILFSCEGEPIDWSLMSEPINLNATIEEGASTRATGSTWEKGDAVGVYMIRTRESLNASALAQNIEYETTGSNSFEPSNESDAIYLPLNGSNVDFIGYYPYKDVIPNFIYPVDLYNQSSQADLDLLYSDNAKGYNETNPDVSMIFSHQLCKLMFNIDYYRTFDLSGLRVIITNVGRKASFNLVNGALLNPSDYGDLEIKVSNDGTLAEAILLPEDDLSAVVLWFIIGEDEQVYKYPLAEALSVTSFEKSTKYTFHVTLHSDETAIVSVGDITNWTEGPTVNMTLERIDENPPIIEGSKKDPFTVAEAQLKEGREDVWVEGYIVGGFTGTSVSSFTTDPADDNIRNSVIAIADLQTETNIDNIFPVQLPSGNLRDTLNLKENATNIGRKIRIKGDLEEYYSAPGMENPNDLLFIE